jgi:hypothetical protein
VLHRNTPTKQLNDPKLGLAEGQGEGTCTKSRPYVKTTKLK